MRRLKANGLPAAWGLRLILAAGLGAAAACAGGDAAPQLRVMNTGAADLLQLAVLFPGPTADAPARRVLIGDVPAGQTSAYVAVPGGVYRYAAYSYVLAGRVVEQAVVDWLGESPIAGERFTYRLKLDPDQPVGGQIQLEAVTTDDP